MHEVVKEALIRIRQAEKVTRAESTAYEKWETTLAVKIGEWLIKNWCDDAALFALDCEVEFRVLWINDGLRVSSLALVRELLRGQIEVDEKCHQRSSGNQVQNPNGEISYFHGTVKVLARLGECWQVRRSV